MANRTDPLANNVSGTDPQNLMEYITRQKIYDSRYWKETCFGLTVADVLEKATTMECIGGLPTHFLALTLKLLQLHPETELIIEAFVEQEEFKYVRALGCLYVRLTGQPKKIYETLEPLYQDGRKLRRWMAPEWSILHMDEYIHQLLTESSVVGMSLPRLPLRRVLQEAGYIDEGPRWTALKDVLEEHGGPLEYLRYKVEVEKSPAAMAAWEEREARLNKKKKPRAEPKTTEAAKEATPAKEEPIQVATVVESVKESPATELPPKKKSRTKEADGSAEDQPKKKKKKERNYGSLFKKDKSSSKKTTAVADSTAPTEGSEEYWNEQRAKLGLKPLKK